MTATEYLELIQKEQQNKYHARKIKVEGMCFDSEGEYARYQELKILERAGEINGLERQKEFVLIPAQYSPEGKLLERKCSYKADFCYNTASGEYVVEDVKGMRTKEYKIKRKLMLYIHKVQISEVNI